MNVGEWTRIRAKLNPDDTFVVYDDDGRQYSNAEFE
jgi:hypothetical protein